MVEEVPASPPVHSSLLSPAAAMHALGNGDVAEAEELARSGLSHEPEHPTWLTVLALALSAQQRAAEALPLFQLLAQVQPAMATHWSNFGNCLCELGREREAKAPLLHAASLGDESDGLLYALARAHVAHAEPRLALPLIQRATQIAPQDVEYRVLLARVLVMLDEFDAAGTIIDGLAAPELDAEVRVEAGYLLLQIGVYADAAAIFSGVLVAQPQHVDAMLGLASTEERSNRLDRAEQWRALLANVRATMNSKQRDTFAELDAQLAARRGDHAAARSGLESLLAGSDGDPLLRGDLWLKLGRSCDALGDTEAAMHAFAQGHAERYADVTRTHAAMPRGDGLLAVLDAPVPELRSPTSRPIHAAAGPRDPVFLVGFPRSGTTLLEQLLDAHDGLASFDEQPFLQRLVTELNQQTPGYPELLPSLNDTRRAALRQRYFSDVSRVLPTLGARRAVDKNPLNIVRLPLVATLFPQAQVLLALRHPCDVVLSCYMQNFRSPAFALTFESLASTARMYARVMAHYHGFADRLGLPVHVIRYEDLVTDVPASARPLFAFLGLPWSDELITFTERAKTKGAISTPSYAQVIQPVTRRAVDRWLRYRSWFEGEVLDTLMPFITRFGYQLD